MTGGIGVGKTHLVQWEVREICNELGLMVYPWHPGSGSDLKAKFNEFVSIELPRMPRPIVLLPDADLGPDDLPDALSASGAQVVIVSRDPGRWRHRAAVVEVGAFARAESIAFLTRHQASLTPQDAAQVAEHLSDLPLALAQAVSHIRSDDTAESFLRRLRSQARVVFGTGGTDWYQSTLAVEIRRAMDSLPATGPPSPFDVLGALALMDGGPYPLSALGRGLRRSSWRSAGTWLPTDRQVPPHRLTMAFRALGQHGLARVGADEVQLDWLTAQVVRCLLESSERCSAGLLAESMLLGTVSAGRGLAEWEDWPSWELSARPLMSIDPEHVTSLQGRYALLAAVHYTLEQGRADEARGRLLQLKSVWHRAGDTSREGLARTCDLLARAGLELGYVKDAREHAETAFRESRSVHGIGHPDTIASALTWAMAAERVDWLPELKALADGVPDHRLALRIDSAMARFELRSSHGPRPVAALQRIVQEQIDILGEEHPDTLSSRHLLACAYAESGQANAAVDEFARVLRGRISTLGIGHPRTEETRAALRCPRESLPPQTTD
ncbi:tetratricopeptide repeat protein [Streptomyces sp. FH025]|uniref:tetratricopeptide repeat protein n=1 Tax=Streptomyces sp. FH025 TaxID=2815937 RepID=UPI001A9D8E66|nr:tetratricopeptide repeat protein [Streptomyces sp. FH025]MBO1415676.1 tetratricopeptide repeat protein [Streptomyces sp. FH025]